MKILARKLVEMAHVFGVSIDSIERVADRAFIATENPPMFGTIRAAQWLEIAAAVTECEVEMSPPDERFWPFWRLASVAYWIGARDASRGRLGRRVRMASDVDADQFAVPKSRPLFKIIPDLTPNS